ncbi:hypothetical protein DQM11_03430 [Leuconostoc pseudomesenteroides]|nr:hypothetical protein DQM11_03430 [Leuconostoc pseudomesenteroides]
MRTGGLLQMYVRSMGLYTEGCDISPDLLLQMYVRSMGLYTEGCDISPDLLLQMYVRSMGLYTQTLYNRFKMSFSGAGQ